MKAPCTTETWVATVHYSLRGENDANHMWTRRISVPTGLTYLEIEDRAFEAFERECSDVFEVYGIDCESAG